MSQKATGTNPGAHPALLQLRPHQQSHRSRLQLSDFRIGEAVEVYSERRDAIIPGHVTAITQHNVTACCGDGATSFCKTFQAMADGKVNSKLQKPSMRASPALAPPDVPPSSHGMVNSKLQKPSPRAFDDSTALEVWSSSHKSWIPVESVTEGRTSAKVIYSLDGKVFTKTLAAEARNTHLRRAYPSSSAKAYPSSEPTSPALAPSVVGRAVPEIDEKPSLIAKGYPAKIQYPGESADLEPPLRSTSQLRLTPQAKAQATGASSSSPKPLRRPSGSGGPAPRASAPGTNAGESNSRSAGFSDEAYSWKHDAIRAGISKAIFSKPPTLQPQQTKTPQLPSRSRSPPKPPPLPQQPATPPPRRLLPPQPPSVPPPDHLLKSVPPWRRSMVKKLKIKMKKQRGQQQSLESRAQERTVDVSSIRYAQKGISPHFSDGRPLQGLVDDLHSGKADPSRDSFLILSCVEKRDERGTKALFASNNRRLWCLKKFSKETDRPVMVRIRALSESDYRHALSFKRNYDTTTDGHKIRKRRGARKR